MKPEELQRFVESIRSLPCETEWVEFKHNNADPQDIGEYISALANGATLRRQPQAFLLWGIEDGTHNLVGTTFRPRETRKGNEELENWLHRLLSPHIDFNIHEGQPAAHERMPAMCRSGPDSYEAPCDSPGISADRKRPWRPQERCFRPPGYEAPYAVHVHQPREC